MQGIQVHVRTCAPLFRVSGTAGRIAQNLVCVVREPLAMRFTPSGGYAHERKCNCTHI